MRHYGSGFHHAGVELSWGSLTRLKNLSAIGASMFIVESPAGIVSHFTKSAATGRDIGQLTSHYNEVPP